MVYNYRTGVIVPFVQKYFKQIILAAAAIFIASISGMSLVTSAAAPNWKLNAGSVIDFSCGGSSYVHTLGTVVDNAGGNFTGTGFYNADPAYTWDAVGNVSGDVLELTITYTGASAVSVYNLTNGAVGVDGSVSGDVDSNCESFTIPAGSLTPVTVTEVDIYGSTTTAENDSGKWFFNRDPRTATPYEFNTDAFVLGEGSLYIEPIANDYAGVDCNTNNLDILGDCDKFIGEYFAMTPISEVESFSYDFKIGAGGSDTEEEQFYLNVYANFGVSEDNKFYDCRYDVVPIVGSTAGFTTVTFDPTQAYPVTQRGTSPFTCPSVPADMDTLSAGSNIRAFNLNVGDTSGSDLGLDGYFDNVVFETTTETFIYDFEPIPTYTVTIDKYLDGAKASAVSANNAAFPMVATWAADNIGAGSGNYELDADGFNGNPTPYQAITSEMNMGADYTTNEVLGTTVATTCAGSGAPFRLVGYTTGDTLEEAQSGTPTTTVPAFTDLQENKFVIVWNETCVYVTNKDECKNNGWMLGLSDGRTFKNQGDCVSYFATKTKNQPAGGTVTVSNARR
jgi:hypothetical protein